MHGNGQGIQEDLGGLRRVCHILVNIYGARASARKDFSPMPYILFRFHNTP